MCCIFAVLLFLGPRAGIVLWWLYEQSQVINRFSQVYDTFVLPFLGFLFLPWTTLTYTLVWQVGGVNGWNWLWVGLGVVADIASYSGSAYGNRNRIPGISSGTASSGTAA